MSGQKRVETAEQDRIPVHVITGALGVGKTTAIRDLLERVRPVGERWAVLVNEVGEIGIDGALLEGSDSREEGDEALHIRQVPGGCICCTNGIMFQMHLTLLLQQSKPDRVIIEPSGVAEPGAILDLLGSEAFVNTLSIGATITLIDPRKLHLIEAQREQQASMPMVEQVDVADVLVANKTDLCDAEQLLRFESFARSCFPPKALVATTQQGMLDGAWLDVVGAHPSGRLEGGEGAVASKTGGALLQNVIIAQPSTLEQAWTHDAPRVRDDRHVHAAGWKFEPSRVFHAGRLRAWLESLASMLPDGGFLRVKGVLQTERGWVAFNLVPDGEIDARATSYRRDARIEVLTPAASDRPDWPTLHERLIDAFHRESDIVAY